MPKKQKKSDSKPRALAGHMLIAKYAKLYAYTLPKDFGKIGKKGGRPTVMTEKTLRKLELGFAYDSTVEEACVYAGITPFTYYEFIKKEPKFSNTVEVLRNIPTLIARHTVVAAVASSQTSAMEYLTKKRKTEFSSKIELGGEIKQTHEIDPESKEAIDGILELFERKARETDDQYNEDQEDEPAKVEEE